MSKKGHYTREWLVNLKGKKISVVDLVPFAMLAFIAYRNSVRIVIESEKINDIALKLSLQIIALEELSKPLFIFEIAPALNQIFNIKDKEIDSFINAFFYHNIKQLGIAKYGEAYGRLGYETKFSDEELRRLESIKQHGFYTEIKDAFGNPHIPFDETEYDKVISTKIDEIFKEKGSSLGKIYGTRLKALHFFVLGSLRRKNEVKAQWPIFLETVNIDDECTFEDLISSIEAFEQTPVDGKLFVDEDDSSASVITMVLLTKLTMKKTLEQVDVLGSTLHDEDKKSIYSEKNSKIAKLIYQELAKPLVVEKVKECLKLEKTIVVEKNIRQKFFDRIPFLSRFI